MYIKGTTYYTLGDICSPEFKSEEILNESLPLIEASVLASFAKGDKTVHYKFLAIGAGSSTLFTNPSSPPTNKTIIDTHLGNPPKLFSEFYRKALTFSRYIDLNISGDNQFTSTNTGVIELIWTFSKDEAVGTWRELGIFSGDATETANTGKLVHYQTLVDFEKTPSFVIGRDFNWHWRLDFNKEE
jgi:hypothetical protein